MEPTSLACADGLVMDSDRDLLSLQRRLGDQVGDIQHASSATVYHDWPEGLELAAESITDVGGIEMKRFERFMCPSEGVVLGYLFDPIDA